MITFEVIRYKNLLSAGNDWIEIPLNLNPMTLIIGMNGAGKSAFIDALCYALFGRAYRKISVTELINSINQSGLLTEIEFKARNHFYKVIRGYKPTIFQIFEDGNLLNQDAASKDYQNHLEQNILGFTYKMFTQIVVVGSTLYVPFMKLSTADRRLIIEDLLDIRVFSTMNRVLKSWIDDVTAETGTLLESIKSTKEKIKLQARYIEDNKRSAEELVSKARSELTTLGSRWESMNANSHLISQHTEQLIAKIKDEKSVQERKRKLEQYHAQITSHLKRLGTEQELFQTQSECPTCHQFLSNKDQVLSQVKEKTEQYNTGLQQVLDHQFKCNARITEISDVKDKIQDHKSELIKMHSQMVEIQNQIKLLEAEIYELGNRKPMSEDMFKLSTELYSQLESLLEQKKQLFERKQYVDIITQLLKDTGIKSHIIRQYLPTINKSINKYLSEMDFYVEFNLDEEFKETIHSRYRDKFSYDNFSEGQKRRIDLSLLFTWRAIARAKNSIITNLLILDEVLDGSLDNDGLEEFTRLLQVFAETSNVFVISHRGDILSDKFDSVFKFEIKHNFSELTS